MFYISWTTTEVQIKTDSVSLRIYNSLQQFNQFIQKKSLLNIPGD
jgi:hypothetical protein